MWISEFADKKPVNNEGRLYTLVLRDTQVENHWQKRSKKFIIIELNPTTLISYFFGFVCFPLVGKCFLEVDKSDKHFSLPFPVAFTHYNKQLLFAFTVYRFHSLFAVDTLWHFEPLILNLQI